MTNPILDEEERRQAMEIVEGVSTRIDELAGDNEGLRFAFLRKVSKELVYLERDSPSKRKRVKRKVWKAQDKVCAECNEPLEFRYSVADRLDATKGYVAANLGIVHAHCDRERQEKKGYE